MQINLDTHQSGLGRVPLATLLPPAQQCGFDTVTFPLWEISTAAQARVGTAQVTDHGLQWSTMPMDLDTGVVYASTREVLDGAGAR